MACFLSTYIMEEEKIHFTVMLGRISFEKLKSSYIGRTEKLPRWVPG